MDKELLEEIYGLVKELEEKLVDLEIEESSRAAPERIMVDMSSEDDFGMFVACRPGEFMNHDVGYVREDLVNCDYYEAYIKNQKTLFDIQAAAQNYEEDTTFESLDNLMDLIPDILVAGKCV